jgi:hypothetical protein
MKTLLTLCLSIILLTSTLAQTVRRVNNNPGITGTNVYATFAAAHDAATVNDVIIIEPSSNTYGLISLTKPLRLYGNGYYLESNPELKADKRNSEVAGINFNAGSSGSEIYGLTVLGTFNSIDLGGVSNIIISNTSVTDIWFGYDGGNINTGPNSNIIITKSMIIGSINFSAPASQASSNTNVLISNNIVGSISRMASVRDQNITIKNNTFTVNAATTIVNSTLENNFYFAGSALTFTNVTANFNVSTGATFNGGSGNVNNYDYSVNAELVGAGTGISADKAYQVKAGKPLKTIGSGGIEVGAYGGLTPYIIGGIPAIPSISTISSTDAGDATTPIKVTISVKSNN